MLRFVASTIGLMLLASPTGAIGDPPKNQPSPKVLQDGLHAVAQAAVAQSQSQAAPKQPDHDQGDDHASDRAIFVVCNHDNPSAQRSAICPQPNSPP